MRRNHTFWQVAFAFAILMCSTRAVVGEMAGKDDWAKGISIQATPDATYPSGDMVVIKYQITNGSHVDVRTTTTGSGFGLKLSLESSSGKKIKPYAYYPLSHSGQFVIFPIPQGEALSMNVDLSDYFPFAEAGEYRATLTRRLYGNGDKADRYREELKGEPIDISSNTFQFRVESPSRTTLSSLHDLRTGATPGDEMDGINNMEWYVKASTAGRSENHLTQKDHTGGAGLFSQRADARYWGIAAVGLLCVLLFGYYRWRHRSGGRP